MIALFIFVVFISGCASSITKENLNSTIEKELEKYPNLKNNQTLKKEIYNRALFVLDTMPKNETITSLKITHYNKTNSEPEYIIVVLNTTGIVQREFNISLNGTFSESQIIS